ncbi:MAG: GSU2403 family nucleotidyltransferase fold protein [Desulfobaccales bacterium]
MATEYFFREFEATQQETLARAIQAYESYLSALQGGRPLKGGMHWKKVKGKDYLYKYRDRFGNGESLGPRSPATERLFTEFGRERRELAERLASRREDLATAARFCRAALIHRVPETVMRIVRRLEMSGLTEAPVTVISTHALYAYEFAAGVFIDVPKGSPFWSGAAQKLTLAAARPIPPDNLLRMLRQADRSFQPLPGNGFQAANKAGFLVKLVLPPIVRAQTRAAPHDAPGPAVPAESGDLSALLGAPKFFQVVIGKRGTPATLVVPDPRALALHKLWLSQQEDREPEKRSRDRSQAMALAELILRYLPQYYFFSSQLNLFPPEVVRPAQGLVEGYELSEDLEID